jgi:endogenous inhibitor of DNA gyrase (YacG/DUF329 family)
MLSRRPEPPENPEDQMQGRCATCGRVVETVRGDARAPLAPSPVGEESGFWKDLWTAECPNCQARIYLRKS